MQFARFLAVGLLNTLFGFACIFVAMRWLGVDYRVANVLGYSAGFVMSFLLNRAWTFEDKGPWLPSALRWTLLVSVCFLSNLAVVIYLREWWHLDPMVAQVGGIVTYTSTSFAGARFVVFRNGPSTGVSQHR